MDPRFFFVHIMKTGGSTFRRHLELQLGADRLYPNAEDEDQFAAKTSVRRLADVPAERWDRIDALTVHMPFFASTILDRPFVTATVLRDPVERTISHLKNRQQHNPENRGWPLEKIYDDPWVSPMGILNYQVKVFALRPSDGADTVHHPLEIDDDRLRRAIDNLARVDLLGLHHDFDRFVDAVHRRFGWNRRSVPDQRVSGPAEVSETLLRRITQDNAADIEFFEQAKRLYRLRSSR